MNVVSDRRCRCVPGTPWLRVRCDSSAWRPGAPTGSWIYCNAPQNTAGSAHHNLQWRTGTSSYSPILQTQTKKVQHLGRNGSQNSPRHTHSPSPLRMVFMGASWCHVFVSGWYLSAVFQRFCPSYPPATYRAPPHAATPAPRRGTDIGQTKDQRLDSGSHLQNKQQQWVTCSQHRNNLLTVSNEATRKSINIIKLGNQCRKTLNGSEGSGRVQQPSQSARVGRL